MKKHIPLLLITLLLLAACSPVVSTDLGNTDTDIVLDNNNNSNDTSDNDDDNHADDTDGDSGVEETLDLSLFPAGEFIGAEYAGLLFSSREEGQEGAWIVDSEGTARHLIAEGDGFVYNPDTFQLAYTAPVYEEDIFILNIATGETTQLTDTPDLLEGSLAFTPDGTMLILNYMHVEQLGPWSGYLGAIDLATGEYLILDDVSASFFGFAVSPRDGTILLDNSGLPFWYSQGTGSVDVPMDTYAPMYNTFASPAFSPDGSILTFTAYGDTAGDGAGIQQAIVTINTTEGTSKILHPFSSYGHRVGPEIAWSPAGDRIAIVTQGEMDAVENGVGLWIINPFSADPDEHLIGMGNELLWSHDGASLLYVDWGTGSYLEAKIMQVLEDYTSVQISFPAGSFPFQWINLGE